MATYELSDDDVEIIVASVLHSRDAFRSYDHEGTDDTLIDTGEAAKRQDLLERVFGVEDWPNIRLKPPER